MSYEVEVVIVKTKNGPLRVNKSDYDADPKAYGSLDAEATETAAASPPPSVNTANTNVAPQYFVSKEGRKFFVMNLDGTKATGTDIDADGYTTEDKAREAMKSLTGE